MEQDSPARQAAIEEGLNRIQGIRESEVPYPSGYDLGIASDQGQVEDGSNPSTHPLRRGGWLRPTISEIAATIDPISGQPGIDKVVLFCVSSMEGKE